RAWGKHLILARVKTPERRATGWSSAFGGVRPHPGFCGCRQQRRALDGKMQRVHWSISYSRLLSAGTVLWAGSKLLSAHRLNSSVMKKVTEAARLERSRPRI